MKVQFVESCVGDRFYFSKGDVISTKQTDVLDVDALEVFLREQVKAGHAIELETGEKAEKTTNKTAVEKR